MGVGDEEIIPHWHCQRAVRKPKAPARALSFPEVEDARAALSASRKFTRDN